MANEEPSKEVLLLADVVLEKYPYQPMHSLAMIPHIMSGQQGKFDNETFNTLAQFAYSNSSAIRDFLLKEGYLKCIDWRNPTDELTEKGKLAKEKGGHVKYKVWEAEEERKKRIEDFPKKKWYIYEPSKIIAGLLIAAAFSGIGYIIGLEKGKSTTKSPLLKDTAQSLPKTLNKKDTAR